MTKAGSEWWAIGISGEALGKDDGVSTYAERIAKGVSSQKIDNVDVVVSARPGDRKVLRAFANLLELTLSGRSVEFYLDVDHEAGVGEALDMLRPAGNLRVIAGAAQADLNISDFRDETVQLWQEFTIDEARAASLSSLRDRGFAGIILKRPFSFASPEDLAGLSDILAAWFALGDPRFSVEPLTSLVNALTSGEPSREWIHWSVRRPYSVRGDPEIAGMPPVPLMALVRLDRLRPQPKLVPAALRGVIDAAFAPLGARSRAN